MLKTLLVGGTGYLGRHLNKIMPEASTYLTGTKNDNSRHYIRIDFSDPQSFNNLNSHKFDIIIVLASVISGIGTTDLEDKSLTINTYQYAAFLNYLKKQKITQKVIYISSMTVYDIDNSSPVHEDAALSPINTYGLSKLLAEQITRFISKTSEMQCLILRLPGIYGGDRTSGIIYKTIKNCLDGKDIIIETKGLGYWETINVEDLCKLLWQLVQIYSWQYKCDVINVAAGERTDFYDVIYQIKQIILSHNKIITEIEKGYVDFHLSNKKLTKYVSVDFKFSDSLRNYINSII